MTVRVVMSPRKSASAGTEVGLLTKEKKYRKNKGFVYFNRMGTIICPYFSIKCGLLFEVMKCILVANRYLRCLIFASITKIFIHCLICSRLQPGSPDVPSNRAESFLKKTKKKYLKRVSFSFLPLLRI